MARKRQRIFIATKKIPAYSDATLGQEVDPVEKHTEVYHGGEIRGEAVLIELAESGKQCWINRSDWCCFRQKKRPWPRLLYLLCLSIILLLACQLTPPTATPTPPLGSTPTKTLAPSGKIAFVSNRDGHEAIYAMNADGSGQQYLVAGRDPAISWRGDWLAWSDGQNILAQQFVNGQLLGNIEQLSTITGLYYLSSFCPEEGYWGNDGKIIGVPLWVCDREGNAEIYGMFPEPHTHGHSWMPKNLTNQPAADTSPDCHWKGVVFQSHRDGNWEIYIMNADGSGQTNITNHPAFDANPTWSPKGDRIVFDSNRDGNPEIYVMNSDGSGVIHLTDNSANDTDPTWSADGRFIAFVSDRNGQREIWVMPVDGNQEPWQLTTTGGWSPDWGR